MNANFISSSVFAGNSLTLSVFVIIVKCDLETPFAMATSTVIVLSR